MFASDAYYEEVLMCLPYGIPMPPRNVVADYEELGTDPEEVARQWLEHLSPQ